MGIFAWFAARGLSTIAVYALLALIAGGAFLGYGQLKYQLGKTDGISQERIAWEETRKRELAKQAAQKAADQARIDQIEADYLALQEQLNQKIADDFLEEAIRKDAQDSKPVFPKSVAGALNRIR
jgi:hypothetical protein